VLDLRPRGGDALAVGARVAIVGNKEVVGVAVWISREQIGEACGGDAPRVHLSLDASVPRRIGSEVNVGTARAGKRGARQDDRNRRPTCQGTTSMDPYSSVGWTMHL